VDVQVSFNSALLALSRCWVAECRGEVAVIGGFRYGHALPCSCAQVRSEFGSKRAHDYCGGGGSGVFFRRVGMAFGIFGAPSCWLPG